MRRDKNVRCCLVCRRAGPKESFWRVVRLHPNREISLDDGMGRSAYVCQTAGCVKQARKKGRLGKALRCQVGDKVYEALEARLAESGARDQLGSTGDLNLSQKAD